MNHKYLKFLILAIASSMLLCSCGDSTSVSIQSNSTPTSDSKISDSTEQRETVTTCLIPEAPGTDTVEEDGVILDISNISEGYIMVKYSGTADKAKLLITVPDGETRYTYTVNAGDYEAFPLTSGDGEYQIQFCEKIVDDKYAVIASTTADVKLADEFRPYLYPNQYSWYSDSSASVAKGRELSDESSDDLTYITNVYNYVIENVTYDHDKADKISSGEITDYVPDADETLNTGKGICFDYASLMTSLLRSQGVPTKLVVGYSGTAYHAWISVYIDEIGWVDNIIEFDGTDWSIMDPTLAASNDEKDVKKYVGDGSNYTDKYWY